jgi:3-oxoacyl-[acyl-carrier protein] reductase
VNSGSVHGECLMEGLNGKNAIVTGASRGIGADAAREFASAGVSVVLVARDKGSIDALAQEINDAGGKAVACRCDVGSYDDVVRAVEACHEHFGRVDILVNNAGVIEPIARLGDSDPALWDLAVDINVKGVYHGIRACLDDMVRAGSGVIVNVSSGAATSALEGWSHYCSTKAAVLSLTRCVHAEYAEHGVRVVGMSPGTVATGMQIAIKASGINPISQLDPSVHIPPVWAARAIVWLCTAAGESYDGGDFSLKSQESRDLIGLS